MFASTGGGEMDPYLPYQVELVKIADRLATRAGEDDTVAYLRRFRTIYRHLAASVVGVSMESGIMAAMGMPSGFSQPNPSDILGKTDEELDDLRR
jgi:hypothetical protein